MNHYYDAYDKRYQIIHKKGYSWSSDTSKAFDMVERNHDSGYVMVPSTSLRMVNFDTYENEIISNNLSIIEKGITPCLPDFNNLMYEVVKRQK